MTEIRYTPIGRIHSPFKEPPGTPIQAAVSLDSEGTVELFPEYAEGLRDIEGFSHIYLIYHFHLARGFSLLVTPYLDDQLHGVFVTRAPARPNPIGLSIVRLVRREGAILYIRDLDIIDGTPLLDIKPYVPEFDGRAVDKVGWLEKHVQKLHAVTDNGRFVTRKSGTAEKGKAGTPPATISH
jgi:tRNA-Thr(GGU) m(6)t(6)A37 methyltransferase TsaA